MACEHTDVTAALFAHDHVLSSQILVKIQNFNNNYYLILVRGDDGRLTEIESALYIFLIGLFKHGVYARFRAFSAIDYIDIRANLNRPLKRTLKSCLDFSHN